MKELIAQLFDTGIFTDSVMTNLAEKMDISQLEVAAIIDSALTNKKRKVK